MLRPSQALKLVVDCLFACVLPGSVRTAPSDPLALGGKSEDKVEKKKAEETKWFWNVGGAAEQLFCLFEFLVLLPDKRVTRKSNWFHFTVTLF